MALGSGTYSCLPCYEAICCCPFPSTPQIPYSVIPDDYGTSATKSSTGFNQDLLPDKS